MRYKYKLERAVNPGEDLRNMLKIVEKAEQDIKLLYNSIKENLDLNPMTLKDFLYKTLKI